MELLRGQALDELLLARLWLWLCPAVVQLHPDWAQPSWLTQRLPGARGWPCLSNPVLGLAQRRGSEHNFCTDPCFSCSSRSVPQSSGCSLQQPGPGAPTLWVCQDLSHPVQGVQGCQSSLSLLQQKGFSLSEKHF